MVRDHSITLCNCIAISPELVGKAVPVGLREYGLEEGKEPLQVLNAKPSPPSPPPEAGKGPGCSDRVVSTLQVHRGTGGPSDL